jgi:fructan beta-fructosidase
MLTLRVFSLFLVFAVVSGCNRTSANITGSNDTTVLLRPTYRPVFHFSPATNWTNDPNGLVYYQGQYHLFFQYNPSGNVWGNMSWGHATSSDLLSWKQQPVAINQYTNPENSTTMVFSGTAVADSFNTSGFGTLANPLPLIAIYTSNAALQNQSLAYSLDGINFTRYSKNPILDIQSTNFRDPKVFWYSPANKWMMIVSMPVEEKVRFYSSSNLTDWQYLSDFGAIGNTSQVWECPDMFELPVQNTGEKKWVITVSGGGPTAGYGGMQYFVGYFDGNGFTADPLSYPLYLDYGKDFYAGITYNNLPSADGRRVMIGWANNWSYAGVIPTLGFRGMMSIPRNLQLIKSANGQYLLTQLPVVETNNFKGAVLFQQDSIVLNNTTNNANSIKGDAMDIEFTVSRGTAAQSGIQLFKNGNEQTSVFYNKSDNTIKLDRTASGNVTFSNNFPSIESMPVPADNSDLTFRILIDESLVEIFVNGGQLAMTEQVFPTFTNGGIQFFSNGGNATIKNINIWKMNASMP